MTIILQHLCKPASLIFGVLLSLPLAYAQNNAQSQKQNLPQSLGTHGMALFGDQAGLYASHLPMFHRPHNFQVLLKIRLADPALDLQLRSSLASNPVLYSISPERFDLQRLNSAHPNPLREFSADVYSGHFERGGQQTLSQVRILVEQVPLFNELSLHSGARKTGQSMLFLGRFAIKKIDAKPDCDWIVRLDVAATKKPLTALTLGNSKLGGAACKPDENALKKALAAVLGLPGKAIKMQTLYFETGDLQ